jgi:hypothetical protein
MDIPKQRFIKLDIKTLAYLGDLMNTFEQSVTNMTKKTVVDAGSKSQKPQGKSPVGR